ncbi:MAG: hypothetical protein ACLQAT_00130 [Candidatus Binataceae bacterium]
MPSRRSPEARDDLDSRAFWIDQLIATVVAGAGCTIYPSYQWIGGGVFAFGLAWLVIIRLVPLPTVKSFILRSSGERRRRRHSHAHVVRPTPNSHQASDGHSRLGDVSGEPKPHTDSRAKDVLL